MKHSTGKPTKAEAARMAFLKHLPCVVGGLRQFHVCLGMTEVHHLLSGNKRRGHLYTIPLCAWHHRGDAGNWMASEAVKLCGPSLARTSKKFRALYGSDDELLALTNKILLENHDARRT